MTKPTALVTGANGYTGSHLCQYLAGKGICTRGMVWAPDGQPTFAAENLELVDGELRDPHSLERALEGIEVVYHIAALYRPVNVPKSMYWDVNVQGTTNLLELAARAGVKRFVHCSTIGVHGTIDQAPADENAALKPDDYYQYTKLKGEQKARDLAGKLGMPTVIVRPAAIYGQGERRFLGLARLIGRRWFVMFGSGDVLYHFIHIDDLCEAFYLCARQEVAIGQTYIIADDHAITLNQITATIAGALEIPPPRRNLPMWMLKAAALACEGICWPLRVSPPIHRRRASWFAATRSFTTAKARRELAFDPKVRIEAGLTDMVQSYREAGWI